MKKYFSLLILFFMLMLSSSNTLSEELPYSNVEAIHSSELVLIGKIQFKGETYKSLEGYELPKPVAGEEGSVTAIEFVVKNNLGDGNYKSGDTLRLEIPRAQLEKFASAPNGGLLAQSSDVLLGFDVLETNDNGDPLRFGVRTEEYKISNSNEQELQDWVDSIRGADAPTLNKLMAEEWAQKGLNGAALKQKLDEQYTTRLNKPIVERDAEFAAAEEAIRQESSPVHTVDNLKEASAQTQDSELEEHQTTEKPKEPVAETTATIAEEKSPISLFFTLCIVGALGVLLWGIKRFFF